MTERTRITLHAGKEVSLQRFHPWVFSGAIKKMQGEPQDGDTVEVYSSRNEFLGVGHYQKGSITVRIFSFEPTAADAIFWKSKLQRAYDFRQVLGFTNNPQTNVYRLVFAEGDGLPGLIIDVYNDTAVVQAHSIGMYRAKEYIANALQQIYGAKLRAVYDKSAETLHLQQTEAPLNSYLIGSGDEAQVVVENGNPFYVDWVTGQKTGFFIDQRENRELLAKYSPGKAVLNTFCYTGGFSVYALNAGAMLVHSVDSSRKAIELTNRNAALNNAGDRHAAFAVDTFSFLKQPPHLYDVIILDPPAFAKHHHVRHNAVMGYKRLNAEALKQIKPGGILFTFSCSQAVDRNLFNNTIMAAAIEAGRNIKVMHHLSQPADHPVSIYHPEGEYLKGLVLFVE